MASSAFVTFTAEEMQERDPRLKAIMDVHCARIESFLQAQPYNLIARVVDPTQAVTSFRYPLVIFYGSIRPETLRRAREHMAQYLGVPDVFIERDGHQYIVAVPHNYPNKYKPTFEALMASIDKESIAASRERGNFYVLLGEEPAQRLVETPTPLFLSISSSSTVHVLVSGSTGSGKTWLMVSMALSATRFYTPHQLKLLVLDPKGELAARARAKLPPSHYFQDECVGHANVREGLAWLADLVDRRQSYGSAEQLLLVLLDEIPDLIATFPDVTTDLEHILSQGRSSRVHVIGAGQRPSAAAMGSADLRAHFKVQVAGNQRSREDVRVATGHTIAPGQLPASGRWIMFKAEDRFEFQSPRLT